jgi:rhamnosyltransferase
MARIAGVVIAYYPDFKKLLYNIDTYIDNLEQLYIVFNSPVKSEEINIISCRHSKVQFIFNYENEGIALALNHTAKKAFDNDFEWLLTMDQDSYFKSNDFFEAFGKSKLINISIFCPNPEIIADSKVKDTYIEEEVLCAITSGNLLNLEIWRTLGGFEEKLFIDEVDNDFCLKATLSGFKVIRFKNIPLIHELGQNKEVSFLFKKYTIITHPPIRAYYIFRNNLYIFRKYKNKFPDFVRSRKTVLLKGLVKIVLFSPEKILNCCYIVKGVRDYYKNSFGCYKG